MEILQQLRVQPNLATFHRIYIMMLKQVVFIFVTSFPLSLLTTNKCCQVMNKDVPKFKFVRNHSRSTSTILLEKIFSSVGQCEEFAVSKNALAFNFYTFGANSNSTIKLHQVRYNCQLLGCPETYLTQMLVSDENSSYHSLYTRHRMPVNGSQICLPTIGLFVAAKKYENYSNAQAECLKMNGKLAHIASAERSVGLSKYIGDMPTYVGLSNRDQDHKWKNEFGEPLSCFRFRAWGYREPSSRGCVTLAHSLPRSPSSRLSFWRVVSCSRVLPFICEISPFLLGNKTGIKRRKNPES